MTNEDLKIAFDKIKATLMSISPFISALIRRSRIILSESVPTACVTPSYTVLVNPNFFKALSYGDKTWVLGHETMHLAFNHTKRGRPKKYKMVFNIAADAVINNMLKDFIRCSSHIELFTIDMGKIYDLLYKFYRAKNITLDRDEFYRSTVEEIYKQLLNLPRTGGGGAGGCIVEGDLNGRGRGEAKGGEASGTILQEGDPDIYGQDKPMERAEQWKKAMVKAYAQQKLAGRIPVGLKRIVDNILTSKVNWRTLLRQAFHNGFGKTIVTTWRRPSRKHADFPGTHRYTYPCIYCLVDTSGSISPKELEQFIAEIYALAKNTTVSVMAWDAEAYGEVKAESQRAVISKVSKMLKGGGGTVIYPALRKAYDRMRARDIVVIFTDGEIFDLEKDETKLKFSEVASKSSTSVFASTHRRVEIPLWHFVKVDVD